MLNSKNKLLVAALACGAAALGYWMFLSAAPVEAAAQTPPPGAAGRAAASAGEADSRLEVSSTPSSKAAARVEALSLPPRTSSASAEFYAAKDLKPFVANARADPARASYFFAARAIRECETAFDYQGAAPAAGATAARFEAIKRRLAERCARLTVDDYKSLRRLGDEGLLAKDVGFSFARPLSSTLNAPPVALQDLVDGLMRAPDAAVFESVMREVMLRTERMKLFGRTPTEIEKSSLPAALLLLTCDVGAPCGESNWLVEYACLANGRCTGGVDELLASTGGEYMRLFNRGARYSHLAALELKSKLAAAIRAGDRNFLTPGDGR